MEPRTRILLALYSSRALPSRALPATSLRRPDDGNALGSLVQDGLVAQRPSRFGLGVVYELTSAGVSQAQRLAPIR